MRDLILRSDYLTIQGTFGDENPFLSPIDVSSSVHIIVNSLIEAEMCSSIS